MDEETKAILNLSAELQEVACTLQEKVYAIEAEAEGLIKKANELTNTGSK